MRQSYMKINASCFEELIEKYNPFAFKDAKGEPNALQRLRQDI